MHTYISVSSIYFQQKSSVFPKVNRVLFGQKSKELAMYREAKTHRMPYLYKVTFPPKSPTIGGSSVMRAMCRVHMCDTWCSYV